MHRSHVRTVKDPLQAPLGFSWVAGWWVAAMVMTLGARLALLILRLTDGSVVLPRRAWTTVALVAEDLWVTLGFALCVAAVALIARRRPARASLAAFSVATLYVAIAAWSAVNVPVARLLSMPLTYAFLHATGSALGDSVATAATPSNMGVPVLLLAGSLAFARWVRPRLRLHRSAVAVIGAIVMVMLALAPAARRQIELSGLGRNAVWVLAETTAARWWTARHRERPSLAAAVCAPDGPAPSDPPFDADPTVAAWLASARGRSIVWVILESTGARSLGVYGNTAQDAMPHLNALARESLIFDAAYTSYPESIKGLYSVLCSREPPTSTDASAYGVGYVPCRPIAEELAHAGYRTGLFHSGWFAYLGMRAVVEGRGFHELRDAGTLVSPHRSSFGVDEQTTVDALLAFVDATPAPQPFFAVFMPIAGHHPYHAPGTASRPFPEQSDHDAYANDLHVADDAFARLRAGVRARAREDQVVYVVIGDHGEAFREHPGNIAHALFLYEENVRVPFFVAVPGGAPLVHPPRRIAAPVSLIDLAPTTLTLAGLRIPGQYQGRPLVGPGRAVPRIVRFATEQGTRRVGLRDGRWKMILDEDSGRAQLFDLAADSEERADVSAAHPDRLRRYRACLQ